MWKAFQKDLNFAIIYPIAQGPKLRACMAFLLRFNRKRELSWVRAAHRAVLFSLLLTVYIIQEMKIQKSTE